MLQEVVPATVYLGAATNSPKGLLSSTCTRESIGAAIRVQCRYQQFVCWKSTTAGQASLEPEWGCMRVVLLTLGTDWSHSSRAPQGSRISEHSVAVNGCRLTTQHRQHRQVQALQAQQPGRMQQLDSYCYVHPNISPCSTPSTALGRSLRVMQQQGSSKAAAVASNRRPTQPSGTCQPPVECSALVALHLVAPGDDDAGSVLHQLLGNLVSHGPRCRP
jgi:hypothetical protein